MGSLGRRIWYDGVMVLGNQGFLGVDESHAGFNDQG